MEDYGSAALVALIRRGLHQQGLAVPQVSSETFGRSSRRRPHAPLDEKKALLEATFAQHGAAPIVMVGQSIAGAPFDPVAHMLLRAPTGSDLVMRWRRLEHYQHSRHRTVVEQASQGCIDLCHIARTGPAPSAPEDLLVAGVLAGFLSAQGCTAVSLFLLMDHRSKPLPLIEQGRFVGPADGWEHRATHRWRLSWTAEPAPQPATSSQGEDLGFLDRPRLNPTSRSVLTRIAADPPHRFTLAGLADELGYSPRTLQRRLTEDGLSLSEAVALARLREATRLLAGSALPVTQIGFVAGYSDAAHFARTFKAATAMTPSEYRAAQKPVALPASEAVS